jgi:hypothetical protein
MKGTEAIQGALRSTLGTLNMYLSDLSDADLLVRPVPNANHIAWQLGHLIGAEKQVVNMVLPDVRFPDLPPGFAEKHTKETATKDDPSAFYTKAEYLRLYSAMRETSIAAIGKLADADLDRPNTSRMAKFAPTVGLHLLMVAEHTTMHSGQFTVVRRKLGKPVLF